MVSGSVVRVLQKLFGAVAGLLVVPIAVNIGTGGTPPPWLAPFTGALWPVALGCVVAVVALELVEQRGSVRDVIAARRPDDPRNIDRALDQVARYVDLRQRNSLAERVRIALALDERPDAVRQPVHLVQRIGGGRFEVREAGDIAAVFEELSGSMLILGAPGAGKSTQLLDLAERLIADARAERVRGASATRPVPVVVDLAEWSRSGRRRFRLWPRSRPGPPVALSTWLGTVLRERYGIPALVSTAWLADDGLVLLLDGLDEVRESDRERCVKEINGLQRSVTRVVVCSRTADYAALREDLRLQGAVEIQPFRRDQVVTFLGAVSPQLRGVADALAGDEELWELLTTPLMLNIMALAYGEGSAPPVPSDGDPETRRRLLFDSYLDLVSEPGLDQAADVDHGAGEGQQRERRAFGAVVAQSESLEPQQPGDGAFDDPADPAEFGLVLDPASGDADFDPAVVQVGAAAAIVIALVGVQLVGSASGPARASAAAAHGGVGVQQRLEHLAVVGVGRGQHGV